MKISNTIFLLQSLSKYIEDWNEKLDTLAGKYGDNAIFGIIVVFVLGAVILAFAEMFAKK